MKNATLKTSKKARLFKCKEGVKYRCTYENGLIKCGKEFPVKSNALQHIRLVHREVPPISIDLEVVELEESHTKNNSMQNSSIGDTWLEDSESVHAMDFNRRIKREKSEDITLPSTPVANDYKIEDLFTPVPKEEASLFKIIRVEGNVSIKQEKSDFDNTLTEEEATPKLKILGNSRIKQAQRTKPRKKCTKFICFNCRTSFDSKHKLAEHAKIHNSFKPKVPYEPSKDDEVEKPFQCELCPWRFRGKPGLETHLQRVHAEARPFDCGFPSCEKTFKSLSELNDHQKSVHILARPYKCSRCPSAFKLSHHLLEHQLRVHEKPKERNFQCKVCVKKFYNQLDLNVHEKRSHLK